ncbi:MAG TPA: methyltransferase, partial [Dehalococcoidia bacterium]
LISEPMLPAHVDPSPAAQEQTLSDLNMLVRTGGQERTEPEFQALLDAASLALVRTIPTGTAHSVIECSLRKGA